MQSCYNIRMLTNHQSLFSSDSISLVTLFSVSEFNQLVANHLRLLTVVRVRGEISQLQISQNKWLFLTLKDAHSSTNVFAVKQQIDNVNLLAEGRLVIVEGMPSLHRQSGKFSINASRILPEGEGVLQLAFDRLKKQLANEGLFDLDRKRELPFLPERLGLITAKGSRAYGDFVSIAQERWGGVKIMFYPVKVQGEGSVKSIIEAISYFNRLTFPPQAIVILRGGGSKEDLWSFNDERLVRMVFGSKVPIVSAIGHEDDLSLLDLVADLRASTPSHAAQLIFPTRQELMVRLDDLSARLDRGSSLVLVASQERLVKLWQSLSLVILTKIKSAKQLISRNLQVTIAYQEKLQKRRQHWYNLKEKLNIYVQFLLSQQNHRVTRNQELLQAFNPQSILSRGYAIVKDHCGKIITKWTGLQLGQDLQVEVSSATLKVRLEKISNHD